MRLRKEAKKGILTESPFLGTEPSWTILSTVANPWDLFGQRAKVIVLPLKYKFSEVGDTGTENPVVLI
jgi:hypothetical protein